MDELHFKPAWWLPNSHFQTLWPSLFRRQIKHLVLKRERLELPDGDFVDLDWADNKKPCPIVMILHGLEGSIESPYAKGMLQALQKSGWRGVFMHFRGCSGENNRFARSYHSGDTCDVDYVAREIKRRERSIPLAAIGFSLGGNVLVKWLGETGAKNPLTAAVAISVPFELGKVARRINRGFSRLYQRHFLHYLRLKMKKKFSDRKAPIPMPPLKQLRTLVDYDNQITAPLHGFKDAEDYYTKSSSRQFISQISIPTLLLQAKDDPFMVDDLLPTQEELPDQVKLELLDKGGHVGFVSGRFPWAADYWLEKRVPAFLGKYL